MLKVLGFSFFTDERLVLHTRLADYQGNFKTLDSAVMFNAKV